MFDDYDFIMEMLYQDVCESGNTPKGRRLINASAKRNGDYLSHTVGKVAGMQVASYLTPSKRGEVDTQVKNFVEPQKRKIKVAEKNVKNAAKRLGKEPSSYLSKPKIFKSAIRQAGLSAFSAAVKKSRADRP